MKHVFYRSLHLTLHVHTDRVLIGGDAASPEPKIFALLLYLMKNSGRVISKSELLDSVWPNESVGEGALARGISYIRKLLRDDPRTPTFIRTAHRRGYEFIPCVSEHTLDSGPASATSG
jgi:DNA-binding winged helix-turn-helix (wHTH) protein